MSEVSILSAQFGELSKTVDQVNQAIIVLKTQMVNKEQGEESKILEQEQGELENATAFMKAFLERLILLEHPDDHSAQLLPNAAVSQLNNTVIAETPDFFDQLRTIQVAIEKQQILIPAQLELLDQIVEALDQERSELFKKLRAARG
jgi:hypothetical protein